MFDQAAVHAWKWRTCTSCCRSAAANSVSLACRVGQRDAIEKGYSTRAEHSALRIGKTQSQQRVDTAGRDNRADSTVGTQRNAEKESCCALKADERHCVRTRKSAFACGAVAVRGCGLTERQELGERVGPVVLEPARANAALKR